MQGLSYRALAWLPVVIVGAFLVAWLAAPASARPPLLVIEVESAKALALVGCATAALGFEPGDYLRRAWTLIGACVMFLFARDVFALAAHPAAGDRTALMVQGLLATLGNGCSVWGTAMLARAWRVAGLEPDGEGSRGALLPAAVILAVLVNGWPIVSDLKALSGGNAFALVPLTSDLADAAVVVMLAPLARTALALQGGLLRWPWVFMTMSGLLWLGFDLAYGLLGALEVDRSQSQVLLEALRALPTLYGFSAGLSQRSAMTGV